MKRNTLVVIVFLLLGTLNAQRIKDITYLEGMQAEQLVGYGLVVGLAGSGDTHRSLFTNQSLLSMLKRFGITLPDDNLRTRNVAAVMITANVPNFTKQGSQFDVTVSSLGDATSLMGGQLLMTPLSSGLDGNIYAFAQGAISIGGYDINTSSGARIVKNHALSGRIPAGGLLQTPFPSSVRNDTVNLRLKIPDFTTSNNIAGAINTRFGAGTAKTVDAGEVSVIVPANLRDVSAQFFAEMERLEVATDAIAKVVVNERTGTIVAGTNVKILPCTISHGNLKISIKTYPIISQPSPFSQGGTVFYNNMVPFVETEDENNVVTINGAQNIQDVAAALNSLRVSPRDIIAIFQAIKESGSLPAELVIM